MSSPHQEHTPASRDSGEPDADAARPPTLWQVAGSVLAAFFGVQNRRNRERDFNRGKPVHFVAMGVLITALFIGLVLLAVKFALRQAGV